MWSNPHWRRVHTIQGNAQRGRWSLLSPGVYLELFSPSPVRHCGVSHCLETALELRRQLELSCWPSKGSFHGSPYNILRITQISLQKHMQGAPWVYKDWVHEKNAFKADRITKWMRAGRAAGIKELGVRKVFDKVPLKILFPIGSDINTVTGTVWRTANME